MVAKKIRWKNIKGGEEGISSYKNGNVPTEAIAHIEAYRRLECKLGIVLNDVREIFFSLEAKELDRFLVIYGQKYGTSPEEWARKSFQDWKNGSKKMSGMVAERLFNLIPSLLSAQQKYKLIKKLCDHYVCRSRHEVTVRAEFYHQDIENLARLLKELEPKNTLKHVPSDILDTIHWLSEDSSTITRAVIAQIEREQIKNISFLAKQEISAISEAILQKNLCSAKHTINLPTATIIVTLEKPLGFFGKMFKNILGGYI